MYMYSVLVILWCGVVSVTSHRMVCRINSLTKLFGFLFFYFIFFYDFTIIIVQSISFNNP